MSDKELLELAAIAAGLDTEWIDGNYCSEGLWLKGQRSPGNSKFWNPLDCDGDAFRLAVQLGFCVSQWPRHTPPDVMVGYRINADRGSNWIEDYGDDPFAATRRAIVCAAAEIGKIIPKSC